MRILQTKLNDETTNIISIGPSVVDTEMSRSFYPIFLRNILHRPVVFNYASPYRLSDS